MRSAAPIVISDQPAAPDRRLPLAGTFNLRDVGGYRTGDGRRIRPRTLFRGDSLPLMPAPARATLHDLGLRTMIDLRGNDEAALWPNVFRGSPDIDYHHIPLPNDLLLHAAAPPPLDMIYQTMLEQGGPALRRILTILARPAAWPALVHCTAGKDRTGVVIALLLGVAGVPAGTIVADYALTARYLAGGGFEAARAEAERHGFAWATSPALLGCEPATMRATLTYLRQFGGVDGYLRGLGVGGQQLRQVRAALAEPVAPPYEPRHDGWT